jgi:flagellar M-ring protein FliF
VLPPADLDDELPVSLSGPSQAKAEAIAAPAAAMNLDDKLEIARTAVSTDPKRVAQVVRDMVASDG